MASKSGISAKETKESSANPDVEIKIIELKQEKTRAKTALTKAKNKMLRLSEEKLESKQPVRDAVDTTSAALCKVIDLLSELAKSYKQVGDSEGVTKVLKEMDDVDETIGEAICFVNSCLTSDGGSVRSGYTGLSRMFKSKKGSEKSETKSEKSVAKVSGVDTVDHAEGCPVVDNANAATLPKLPTSHVNNPPTRYDIGHDMWKQLKRVSIPIFSGDVRHYEGWKAAFMACVDHSPATSEYKLLQLKQYLRGEAAQLVEKLGHSATAYDVALEKLERKYGGKRRQIGLKMEEITNFRPLRPGNAKDIDRFSDMLDVAVVSLRENDKIEELGDGCLYSLLLKKMTETMIIQYERWVFEHERQESVETLREWVLKEAEFMTVASETKHSISGLDKTAVYSRQNKSSAFFGVQGSDRFDKCSCCGSSGHAILDCSKFASLTVPQRWDKVKALRLCFRCLTFGHQGKSCKRSVRCEVNGCNYNHNRLLHSERSESTENALEEKDQEKSRSFTVSSQTSEGQFSALRTVAVILKNGDHKLVVNALLDDASTRSYINEDVASELNLSGQAETVSVNVLNDKMHSFTGRLVSVGLESLDGNLDTKIEALTTTRVTGKMPVINWKKEGQNWSHLKGIQFPKTSSRPIVDILLGMDYIELHHAVKEVMGKPGEPVARLTPLGWTCVGHVNSLTHRSHFTSSFYTSSVQHQTARDKDLDVFLNRFWTVEDIPNNNSAIQQLSVEDRVVVDKVRESLTYTDSRYQISVPWKGDRDNLPNNKTMAMDRLISTERKLLKNNTVADAYSETFDQYLKKGYIKKVEEADASKGKWYLPHFPVVKFDRSTTKVRVVFDASAKYQGISLNDIIHQGPKLQNDLFEILLRFRKYPIAVICDIAEMYLQIEVSESDRSSFRFLWRSLDQSKDPDVYEFTRVVFGVNCSPFLAQFVSQEHARKMAEILPLASETVCLSTYMDDNMDSVKTESEAVELFKQLDQLWSSAGMHARKWISNSKELLEIIPQKDRLSEIDIKATELPSTKALGLLWNAESDVFTFTKKEIDQKLNLTKRVFLSEVSKLFDPVGFLSPFVIRAKMILQEMWISGVGWDTQLSPDLDQKCWQWLRETEYLQHIQFPRCLHFDVGSVATKLHVFVDASEMAYGAVVYAVNADDKYQKTSRLVAAKSRVAPLRSVSIPRMELLAAVLGVKLAKVIVKALGVPCECLIYWSDSQNVLWWIANQSRIFKPFVANRVGFIQENSQPNQWFFVPSELNSADVISRGTSAQELDSKPWTNGPDFLALNESEWPSQPIYSKPHDQIELKKQVCLISYTGIHKQEIIDPNKYSSWKKMCRILAWIFRFLNNVQKRPFVKKKGELDVEEISDAEIHVLVNAQKEGFTDEYADLWKGNTVAKSSKLLALQPFLDENGQMRVGGRLCYADVLSYDARCPIILPRHGWVTKLVVKHFHEQCQHMGTNRTLALMSTKFWVIAAREAIREYEKQCTLCCKNKAKPASQLMAPLPQVRVRCSLKAFEQVGVDYAGPFLTKQGRGKQRLKRYLCLFTCLATRAVHLEMAYGLDSDAFLAAFFRFADRRGVPSEVVSDNGTNFVGASKELNELISNVDSSKVQISMANYEIKWKFNPPHAPHFGGVFESLIKSAKRAIYAILRASDVTDEELVSAFTGAEALLNSRPITYQTSHPGDEVPLTPNHFLHGQLGGKFAPVIDAQLNCPQRRWRRVQELSRHIWRRWLQEWLPMLNSRKKWLLSNRDVQVDDVVIVVSTDSPRCSWPLGRVLKVYPGKDGHVRVVDVKVGKTQLTRPVTKICPLEWSM